MWRSFRNVIPLNGIYSCADAKHRLKASLSSTKLFGNTFTSYRSVPDIERSHKLFHINPASPGCRPCLINHAVNKCSIVNVTRNLHVTPRHRIPPVVWLVLRPVMKMTAILSGRAYRKWWQNLPKDKKSYLLDAFMKARYRILAVVAVLITAVSANYVMHLQEAPITKRKRFICFTQSQYQKIADFEAQIQVATYESQFLPVDHPAVLAVKRVTGRLYQGNKDIETLKSMNFSVAVVNDDSNINAFVLPTGHIFVFTGLLNLLHNDDQLAVVLGHEMAHALLSHSAEQVSMTQYLDLFVIVAMAAIWAFLPSDGIALVTQWFYNKVVQIILEMPYTRNLEREADEVGLILAAKACYDVREAPYFWSLMSVLEKLNETEKVEWLSTHPSHDNRAANMNDQLRSALDVRRSCQCPQLTRKDPREAIAELHHLLEVKQNIAGSTTPVPPVVIITVPSGRGALMRSR